MNIARPRFEDENIDVVILTALSVETGEVLAYAGSSGVEQSFSGDTLYHVFEYATVNEATLRIAVAEIGAGQIEAAAEVGRVATAHPSAQLFFVGIAGAFKDLKVGDVIAADEVIYSERMKRDAQGDLFRPRVAHCSPDLVQIARMVVRSDLAAGRHKDKLRKPPVKAVVGQIASGEELVKDKAAREALSLRLSDAIAVENEGYGFAQAAATSGRMQCLIVRGISDKADAEKKDDDHANAASAACAFAFTVLDEQVRLGRLTRNVVPEAQQTPPPALTAEFTRAQRLLDLLTTDEDLLADDSDAAAELAADHINSLNELTLYELSLLVAAATDDASDSWTARRLRSYSRELARGLAGRCDPREADPDPDHDLTLRYPVADMFKASPTGAAVMLSVPDAWRCLDELSRRRVFTGLAGSLSAPRTPTRAGWACLLGLWEAGDLKGPHLARLQEAVLRASYADLRVARVPMALVQQRLVQSLKTGLFEEQNPAARFLYRESQELPGGLSETAEVELGRALQWAQRLGAHGAAEALRRSQLVKFPAARKAGVLLESLFRDDDLQWQAGRIELVSLAAANIAGDLLDVLAAATAHLPEQVSRRGLPDDLYDELLGELRSLGDELPEAARPSWTTFVSEIDARRQPDGNDG